MKNFVEARPTPAHAEAAVHSARGCSERMPGVASAGAKKGWAHAFALVGRHHALVATDSVRPRYPVTRRGFIQVVSDSRSAATSAVIASR